jgi:hypothetical protein
VVIIIAVFSGITVISFFWGVYLILTEKKRNIKKRMEKYTQAQVNLSSVF